MEETQCTKSNFFEKELLDSFQVNVSFLHPTPKRLQSFSNPFRFLVVLEMKCCSEIDYIVVRVAFV